MHLRGWKSSAQKTFSEHLFHQKSRSDPLPCALAGFSNQIWLDLLPEGGGEGENGGGGGGLLIRQFYSINSDKVEQLWPHLLVGLGPHVQDESSSPFLP